MLWRSQSPRQAKCEDRPSLVIQSSFPPGQANDSSCLPRQSVNRTSPDVWMVMPTGSSRLRGAVLLRRA